MAARGSRPPSSSSPLRGLHLHFDPVAGIAGDMTVAALVDAGVPPGVVSDAVAAIGVPGLRVRFEKRTRGAFVGRGFVVDAPDLGPARVRGRGPGRAPAHDHPPDHAHDHAHDHADAPAHDHAHAHHDAHAHAHRDYAEIRRLLRRAKLDADAKALAGEIFRRLAEAEAELHGSSIDEVAFHELGAFDSIADVVGTAAAIAWLAPVSIGSVAPVVGTGTVRTAHGIVPVPAPATAALLRGVPLRAEGEGELTTPTGAAILASVVDVFGPPPPLRIAAIGYGAGTRVLGDRANVLRVLIGHPVGRSLPAPAEDVLLCETNIDDMSGQLVAALGDALFAAGALDVWSTAITMKKGRPGQQVSAIVEPERLAAVERAFFLCSTTIGLRIRTVARTTLARSITTVETPYGSVSIKVASWDGEPIGAQPEFEDCRRLAAAAGVPVRRVWTAATGAAAALAPKDPRAPRATPAVRAARKAKNAKNARRPARTSRPTPRKPRRA